MRKVLLAFALVLGAMAFNATPAFAGGADTCPTNDGKYEADNDAPGDSPAPGITVTSESENSVTFTVAAGTTLVSLCVKSGNNLSGHSVSGCSLPASGPATCVVTTSGQGNGISHLSFDVTSGGGSTSTSTATTGGGDTSTATTGGGDTSTATTGGGDTSTATTGGGDTSTATTGGGDTGTTTGSTAAAAATTTGGGDAGGGGGGGAGGGGGGGGSGELPFTGLPVLIPLLLGGALLGSGLVLLRRGRQED